MEQVLFRLETGDFECSLDPPEAVTIYTTDSRPFTPKVIAVGDLLGEYIGVVGLAVATKQIVADEPRRPGFQSPEYNIFN
jgi:hypothetical protein